MPIDTIRTALRRNPDVSISILTDALRGTREAPEPSCASLLAPLVSEFGSDRVEIRMFHTPNLTGIKKRILPKRINEGWGLQHMKLYGVDDELIMSGANLSSDYFTNRQDRYHVFSSSAITAYFARIHDTVCSISFDIQPEPDTPAKFSMSWLNETVPSPLANPKGYVEHSSTLLSRLIRPSASSRSTASSLNGSQSSTGLSKSSTGEMSDTTVYPLSQLTPLFTPSPPEPSSRGSKIASSAAATSSTELPALHLILRALQKPPFFPNATWTFTAGYFNAPPQLQTLLLRSAAPQYYQGREQNGARGRVLTAHPYANGFFGSAGISGMLPSAYTLFASRFVRRISAAGADSNISLFEWRKGMVGKPDGWTYHAKGLWVTLAPAINPQTSYQKKRTPKAEEEAQDAGPSLTLVGSSNYTSRSATLDLEANALILTTNHGLRTRLKQEEEWLFKEATKVEGVRELEMEGRKVGWRVRLALWVVDLVGGAL
ncbi:MAG: CDP-diacylglycerol--glycerol-3-phosphate 3-phosphatidyltransferase [Chrysothrix sp. TS-e1954]|nr:MAG: CDP-diacylglycerol--glycerol-3-phosphate 3-phosphatidyltransferase [Chrysothrix sp. TS-e1954]